MNNNRINIYYNHKYNMIYLKLMNKNMECSILNKNMNNKNKYKEIYFLYKIYLDQ